MSSVAFLEPGDRADLVLAGDGAVLSILYQALLQLTRYCIPSYFIEHDVLRNYFFPWCISEHAIVAITIGDQGYRGRVQLH